MDVFPWVQETSMYGWSTFTGFSPNSTSCDGKICLVPSQESLSLEWGSKLEQVLFYLKVGLLYARNKSNVNDTKCCLSLYL